MPLAISFLYITFKQKHERQFPQDIFHERLDAYIEYINETLSDEDQYKPDAGYYIKQWVEAHLIRIRNRDDGYVVQLSPHADRLIGWFEDMQQRDIIGTESKLRNIQTLLEEVVTYSTEDVEVRLHQLEAQREQIDADIKRIKETNQIDEFSNVQIRERLEHISGLANQLLRDFGQVEERFREIAQNIQKDQLDPTTRRGDILGRALDAEEQLEKSDEGQSFRAFYDLLTLSEQRDSFEGLIERLFSTPRLTSFVADYIILRHLTAYLLDAGEHVIQSNQRLAEHLRRVVDIHNITESRNVQRLAGEIKHLLNQLGDDTPAFMNSQQTFYTVEGDPIIDLPLERPLFEPREQFSQSERPQSAPTRIDLAALVDLYDTLTIDETILRGNITRLLMSRNEITLAELVDYYPIEHGVTELIAYLQVATGEPQHVIEQTIHEEITLQTSNNNKITIIVPRIVFKHPV